jgi:hypothetical protein
MSVLDHDHHKVIGGNHDNYTRGQCFGQFTGNPDDKCLGDECLACQGRGYIYPQQTPHFLGDFGTWTVPMVGEVFFVRGAWSIDWEHRIPGLSWWDDEQLKTAQMHKAMRLYSEKKPRIMVTHTAPDSVVPEIPRSKENIFGPILHHPATERFLDTLFEIHKPEMWFFGHWHKDWHGAILGTEFYCLNELSVYDFGERE